MPTTAANGVRELVLGFGEAGGNAPRWGLLARSPRSGGPQHRDGPPSGGARVPAGYGGGRAVCGDQVLPRWPVQLVVHRAAAVRTGCPTGVLENTRTTTDARGGAGFPSNGTGMTVSLIAVLTSPTSCIRSLWRVVLSSVLSVVCPACGSPPAVRGKFPRPQHPL